MTDLLNPNALLRKKRINKFSDFIENTALWMSKVGGFIFFVLLIVALFGGINVEK